MRLPPSTVLLLDTDVIIDYLRGQAAAVAYIESLTNPLSISAVTIAELYSGVREGHERTALDSFVAAFKLVKVDQAIAIQGGLYRRDYGKSHNVGLADAMIAATATASGATLVTLNQKHFPMLTAIIIPYTKD